MAVNGSATQPGRSCSAIPHQHSDLLLVVTLVFLAFQLIPGDPARMYLGVDASQEAVEQVRQDLGLDKPVLTQYVNYMTRLAVGRSGQVHLHAAAGRPGDWRPASGTRWSSPSAAIVFATVIGVLARDVRHHQARHRVGSPAHRAVALRHLHAGLLAGAAAHLRLQRAAAPPAQRGQRDLAPLPHAHLLPATFSLAFITRMTRSSLLEVMGPGLRADRAGQGGARGRWWWAGTPCGMPCCRW